MKPLDAPEFLRVYMLLQQSTSNLYFMPTGTAGTVSMGTGMYPTRDQAEQARTVALLADKTNPPNVYHVFELEIPNPAYQKTS
jgi:hypothetical protein